MVTLRAASVFNYFLTESLFVESMPVFCVVSILLFGESIDVLAPKSPFGGSHATSEPAITKTSAPIFNEFFMFFI